MSGLKSLWDLGDPNAVDPAILRQIEQDKQALLGALEKINESLRYTAANTPQPVHNALASRRDSLLSKYHGVIGADTPDADTMRRLVEEAGGLQTESSKLETTARDYKQRWEREASRLESVEDAIAEADEEEEEVLQLRQGLQKANEAAKQNDYQSAVESARSIDSSSVSRVNEQRYDLGGPLAEPPAVPTDPDELASWENPLINGDPRDLFDPQKMDDVVDMHFQGESNEEDGRLNDAMRSILFAEPGADVSEQVRQIAELRGLDPKVAEEQFARFKQLQDVAEQMEQTQGLDPDDVMGERREDYLKNHGDFLGTRSSLRFGQVIGEATGLDPAFAAMLNPTGGMVGPGQDVLAPTDADSPVIWHGIFHDAGGYLKNYQNTGPGYTYLQDKQPESGRAGAHPFQGQVEGVSYWYARRQPDRSPLEDLYAMDGERMAYDAYVQEPIENVEEFANNLTQDAVDKVSEVADSAREANQETADDIKSASRNMAEGVTRAANAADHVVDGFANAARELGLDPESVDSAERSIEEKLEAVRTQVAEWDAELAGKVDRASAWVDEGIDSVDQWASDLGGALQEKTSGLADDVEEEIHEALVALGQNEDVLDFARKAVNFYGETTQDVEALKRDVAEQIAAAKEKANELYQQAEEKVEGAVDALADARDAVVGKLNEVEDAVSRGADKVAEEMGEAGRWVEETGQDLRDAASNVVDSMADVVESGTDTLANTWNSASDFAKGSLDSLTNLLG